MADDADIAKNCRIASARATKMCRWFEHMATVDDYRRDYFLSHASAMANMSGFWFARADAVERAEAKHLVVSQFECYKKACLRRALSSS